MAEKKLCITPECGRYAVKGFLYCEIHRAKIRVHHVSYSKKAAKKRRTMVKKAAKKARRR